MKLFNRFLKIMIFAGILFGLYAVSADAYVYPDMPSSWENLTVVIGSGDHAVQLPLYDYPDGATWPGDKTYMTINDALEYGVYLSNDVWLRGSQCCGFARYVYCACYYPYSQDVPLDNSLAYKAGTTSSAFYEVGTLPSGYTASQLKALMTQAKPGAVIRISGHSMVVMAIFNDGVIIYDANFSDTDEVDVRKYTWETFASKLGYRGIETLQMPTYYPGYTYYINGIELGTFDDDVDYSYYGDYVTYGFEGTLNVRSQPDTYSAIAGTLNLNDVVKVLCRYGNWYAINFNGEICWVFAQYLTPYDGTTWADFYANGGVSDCEGASYTAGEQFGWLPSCTRANRTFAGWYYGDTLLTPQSIVPKTAYMKLDAAWYVYEFEDVPESAWFAEDVSDGVQLGLVARGTQYRPNDATRRCEFVSVLARYFEQMNGCEITNAAPAAFWDVSDSSYYGSYVGWGVTNGIVYGTSDSTFSPDDAVTREQIACFLYRYVQKYGLISGRYTGAYQLDKFLDGNETDSYAVEAMNWAISVGLFMGDDNQMLRPLASATRAEMVSIFVRFVGLYH